MAINLDNMTVDQLKELAAVAAAKAEQLVTLEELAQLEEVQGRRQRVAQAEANLTALLGPENSPPYVPGGDVAPSIRGLLAYPPEIMAENAGIALQMLFQGLEQLAINQRDLANIVSSEID